MMNQTRCITIDGPAGSGKSTVAKLLAARLSKTTGIEFEYLDTGSMYRSIALLGIRHKTDWQHPENLVALAQNACVTVDAGRTFLDGEDVTELVRQPKITEKTRFAADNPDIRELMVRCQRETANRYAQNNKGLVTEGRDQGTVVFPDSLCKFFVTATPRERARRRCGELEKHGIAADFDQVLEDIQARDRRDSVRQVGPLRQAEDAIEILTDGMEINAVVDLLIQNVLKRLEF